MTADTSASDEDHARAALGRGEVEIAAVWAELAKIAAVRELADAVRSTGGVRTVAVRRSPPGWEM